jgi:hypothetical protein
MRFAIAFRGRQPPNTKLMGLLLAKLLARISAPGSLWLPYAYAPAAGGLPTHHSTEGAKQLHVCVSMTK